ncbi:hypothetical protein ANCDUO_11617 [Ancylostoma duodenale]|uniref:Uncharacterized protein n=1 Tax=Ancylostoma duodenale TaxID=51022 RepID=A0A0C2GM90_9BILA|nr:hypothetical protein ANCDUO_11617 [Ancylostoma duodenale]
MLVCLGTQRNFETVIVETASPLKQPAAVILFFRLLACRQTVCNGLAACVGRTCRMLQQTCSPIFIGIADDDYMQPTSNSFAQSQPKVVLNASQLENPRPASVNVLRRPDGPASATPERPRSVDVVVTSRAVPKAVHVPVATTRAASAQEAKSSKRKLLKTRSLTQPIAVNLPDESDYMIPVASTNQRTAGGYIQPVLTQSISMNLPDESDEMRPVREYLPERVPGAPTVVSFSWF